MSLSDSNPSSRPKTPPSWWYDRAEALWPGECWLEDPTEERRLELDAANRQRTEDAPE